MDRIPYLFTIALFLVHCLIPPLILAAAPSSITKEKDALLALKAHITYDPTNFFAKNWNTNTSVCNWTGITCDNVQHRVTALNISGLDLAGTVPFQLGNLSSLQTLDLSNNRLFGTIPSSIFSIHTLKSLTLPANQLSGSFPSFYNISSLLTLDFRNNNLSGELPANMCNYFPYLKTLRLRGNLFHGKIPSSISSCKQLQLLSLSLNRLSGAIPKELGNLTQLKELRLGHNSLQDEIPHEIGDLRNLEILDLQSCNLIGVVPVKIFNMSAMKILSLSNNSLKGSLPSSTELELPNAEELYLSNNNFIGPIPSFIFNASKLSVLAMAYNRLQGTIPFQLGSLSSLQILSLEENMFHGEIPTSISSCKQLQLLSLSDNRFSGVIPIEFRNLTELKELYLGRNTLQGAIPKEFGNLIKLKELSLGDNTFQGEIPHEIGNLSNLEILDLQSCNLIGDVPATIFNMSAMKSLSLYNNSLTGSLPSSIDIELPNAEELYFSFNNFSGQIPSFILNASKLSLLAMSGNSFSGFIPSTFGNLRNLERIELADNYLTSSALELSFLSSLANCKNLRAILLQGNPLHAILPSSIGNLSSSLEYVDLDNCNISGSIPKEIENLINLIGLDFGANKLNGSIPDSLGKLQKLQVLDLQNNKLEGSIPDNLCHLAALYELALQGNKLSGSIPTCLGNLSTLRNLFLGSNRLTSIPSTFWNLKDMLTFDFSSNSFAGPLPLEIGNLKVVIKMDLSNNHFSSDIPTTIGSQKDLQFLSLGYNRLTGSIPESFGDLTSLESLNLCNNSLSGVIPKSMEKLSHLKHLNLSFNRLEGEIPEGGSFANFSAESFAGNDLLCGSLNLHVPPCKSSNTSTHRKSKKNVLLLGVILPLSIAFILVLGFVLISRYRKKSTELPNDANVPPLATMRRFSYLELWQATDRFSEGSLLGTGSFGSVYRARFQDGMEVAVKVFHLQFERAFKSFDAECEVMKSIRHRNLVKIISSCSNDDFKALVLEYMPNGSLEKCLYSDNCVLDIFQRLNVMIDVASALEYLHFGCSTPVVHCDLKPSNVLLDENMVAHLSDFGIAKYLSGEDHSMTLTQTLATIGYMAPEYGREGKISTRGDVYSYGILLMETFTRKKPTDEFFAGEMSLKSWVNDLLHCSVIELADSNLLSKTDKYFAAKEQCVSSILNLALECTTESPKERISTKNIATRLLKIRNTLNKNVRG